METLIELWNSEMFCYGMVFGVAVGVLITLILLAFSENCNG